MNEEKNDLGSEYIVGLILAFIPALLLNRDNGGNDKSYFWITVIILLVNVFLFIRVRFKTVKLYKSFIFSSAALAMSIWMFLHCLFIKYIASQEFVIWLTRQNKGMAVFNSNAFSFFVAAIVLLLIAGIEIYRIKYNTMRIANYIFIGVCSLIIIAYVAVFPDIILSKPKIKLSKSEGELTPERSYGELFHNGQFIEGYKNIRFEWYLDGQRIHNGTPYNKGTEEKQRIGDTKGIFQIFLTPPPKCENCEKIKSNIIEILAEEEEKEKEDELEKIE